MGGIVSYVMKVVYYLVIVVLVILLTRTCKCSLIVHILVIHAVAWLSVFPSSLIGR